MCINRWSAEVINQTWKVSVCCHEWHLPKKRASNQITGITRKHLAARIHIQVRSKCKKGTLSSWLPVRQLASWSGGAGWGVGGGPNNVLLHVCTKFLLLNVKFLWTSARTCLLGRPNNVPCHLETVFLPRCLKITCAFIVILCYLASNLLALAFTNSPNYVSIILLPCSSLDHAWCCAAIIFLVVTQDLFPFLLQVKLCKKTVAPPLTGG